MISSGKIDWGKITGLAEELGESHSGAGQIAAPSLELIGTTLNQLIQDRDWPNVIRLREIFTPLIARDAIGVLPLFQRMSQEAIHAAEQLGDKKELAHLLGANGHNLHRQGLHRESILAFDRAAQLYREVGDKFEAVKNYYMTSLCYMGLGETIRARRILDKVLEEVGEDNPWRGNPFQVKAWMARDEGDLQKAERLLHQALDLQKRSENSDILVAGTLADLGEVVGLKGSGEEAKDYFRQSLEILGRYEGQYTRQEARTQTKQAELLMREGNYEDAITQLNQAYDKVRVYGTYYDQLWKTQMLLALVYFRQGKWWASWGRIKAAREIYKATGRTTVEFVKQVLGRIRVGSGFST